MLIVVSGHCAGGDLLHRQRGPRDPANSGLGVVERLGKFKRTLNRARTWWCRCWTRSATTWTCGRTSVPFLPQGVITEDNLMVNIDSVIYFQIIDPVRAAYEAPELHQGDRAADHDHAAQHHRRP